VQPSLGLVALRLGSGGEEAAHGQSLGAALPGKGRV
jgi:hypothetical protein